MAFVYGRIGDGKNVLTRLHRANLIMDVFGGAKAVRRTLARFKAEGRGVLVVLRDGTAGVPVVAIPKSDETASGEARNRQWREVGLGAQILKDLGVSVDPDSDVFAAHDLCRPFRLRHRDRGHGAGRGLKRSPQGCGKYGGAQMTGPVSRIGVALAVIGIGLTVSGCGYNTIPTLEEQAKARWADVQNQYQRRADLIPNLVETVKGYAAQEKSVLTAVVEARAKATQIKIDASQLTDPDKLKAFQDAQNQLTGALGRLLAVTRELSRSEIQRQFPGAAVAARRHREPHRRRAARLHRRGARLQHGAAHLPDPDLGEVLLLRQQADGGIHGDGGFGQAAAGEVLMAPGRRSGAARPAGRRPGPLARSAITAWSAAGLVLCLALSALAFDFPPLTGRIVDQAGVIKSGTRGDLEEMLKGLEDKSGIQLVVATVKSLQGSDIETYANQLFRFWKLGEAKKNNGVLLLVAPAEHKVRIEVGYGLEGTLTDALSSVIVSSAIIPRFKTGDFSGGIERGVEGIISVLSGDTADWQPKPTVRHDDPAGVLNALFPFLFFLAIILIFRFLVGGMSNTTAGRYVNRGGRTVFVPSSGSGWGSSWGGGGGSFGGGGGGFSGGGGSSGGGGASGSW